MTPDPKKTAVVLIEFQNDFTCEGGALHGAVEGVMGSTDVLDHARRWRPRRAKPALRSPIIFAEGDNEITEHP